MFMNLFLKECKQLLKCLTYYIFLICLFLFFWSQMGEETIIRKPQPGQDKYGTIYSEDEDVIMKMTTGSLVLEYYHNQYATYPIGFYKEVTLNDKEMVKMNNILSEATGLSDVELREAVETYLSGIPLYSMPDPLSLPPLETLTYERFLTLMKNADKLLGGGSNYNESNIKSNAQVPMTYEDALTEYNEILEKDHLSGAYARLFSDYMSITLAILPVFIAVTRGLRDKRAKMHEVIYSRNISSFSIIASRYLAMLVMMILPVFLLSIQLLLECIYYGGSIGITVDNLAFVKYILGWILPSVMIATSVGVFLTELTDTAIAILVQGLWWFVSILMSSGSLVGNYGWNLVPRHNSIGDYQIFSVNFEELVINRISYAAFAIILVLATVAVYSRKRKGQLNLYEKIFKHRKIESEI